MSTPEEIASALDAAADYIEVHGWCQNRLADHDGRVCLYGALIRSRREMNYFSGIIRHALREVDVRLETNVIVWNDEQGRTEFEVVDALRLTAKDLRNEVGA